MLDEVIDAQAASLREQLLGGLCSYEVFARAIGKTDRTVATYARQGMPVRRVGKTPYVDPQEGLAWLNARGQRQWEPRGRGRPRKSTRTLVQGAR